METVGVEPTVPEAADLQSAGVTNFPTSPCSNYNTLPLCCQPAPNGRSGRGECVLKYTNNAAMRTGLQGPAVPIVYFNTLPFSSHKSECHPIGRPFAHVLSAG